MKIHPEWRNHPMVKRAVERTDGSPEEVLLHLHDIITEVEERFPGVPFSKLLAAGTPEVNGNQRRSMHTVLRRLGAAEADIALITQDDLEYARADRERKDLAS